MKTQELRRIIREEIRKALTESHENQTNYMFFQNLHTIKRMTEKMMEMDSQQVDQLLSSGHAWAVDHIATSTDDISEVATWLCNELNQDVPTIGSNINEFTATKKTLKEADVIPVGPDGNKVSDTQTIKNLNLAIKAVDASVRPKLINLITDPSAAKSLKSPAQRTALIGAIAITFGISEQEFSQIVSKIKGMLKNSSAAEK